MCELLGISGNKPVSIEFSLGEFRERGKWNSDGWGFARWEGTTPVIEKSAGPLVKDCATAITTGIKSSIWIGHVRLASAGSVCHQNSHPFTASLGGRTFVFAHNGTLRGFHSLKLKKRKPEGGTDSEHAFLWLIENLEGVPADGIRDALVRLGDEAGKLGNFNFLLSDGERLWARSHGRLRILERRPPHQGFAILRDSQGSAKLAEIKGPDERAVILASEPLSDERGWKDVPKGEVLEISNGEVRRQTA